MERLRDADVLVEEAGAAPAEAGPFPGDAEILAGEAAGEEINTADPPVVRVSARDDNGTCRLPCCQSNAAHIIGSLNTGPPGGEDALAESVVFDLGDDGEPGPFEAEVEAADGMPANSDTTVLSGIGHLPLEPPTVVTLATVDVKGAVMSRMFPARRELEIR